MVGGAPGGELLPGAIVADDDLEAVSDLGDQDFGGTGKVEDGPGSGARRREVGGHARLSAWSVLHDVFCVGAQLVGDSGDEAFEPVACVVVLPFSDPEFGGDVPALSGAVRVDVEHTKE